MARAHLQIKQKQAESALKICDITDAKRQGWKEEKQKMLEELSKLNDPPPMDIDITSLGKTVTP